MIQLPENQTNLFGLNKIFINFMKLYNDSILPNKILISGPKGAGKCTLAYHLINFILSKDEDFTYDFSTNTINPQNKSFKLVQNKSSPNLILIDVNSDKKKIEISQIRNMIANLNKTCLNSKPRFVLIDNIQYLNLNSINALLKILEEPNNNIYFILINNNRSILHTLKSRCLEFKIFLTNNESSEICKKLLGKRVEEIINQDLLDYYYTPGKILNLVEFANENSIDLAKLQLKEFLLLIISKSFYKKNILIQDFLLDYFELFLMKNNTFDSNNFYEYFIRQYSNVKKYNLDEESFFIEFKEKLLHV
tara:strand:+ start:1874 stop:2794 length:921 start_codon:yes stop_codon:yes gene_type:complete